MIYMAKDEIGGEETSSARCRECAQRTLDLGPNLAASRTIDPAERTLIYKFALLIAPGLLFGNIHKGREGYLKSDPTTRTKDKSTAVKASDD